MGNSASSPNNRSDSGNSFDAYKGAAEFYSNTSSQSFVAEDNIDGGDTCCGGADSLKDFSDVTIADIRGYDKSLNSLTKQSLVDDILGVLKGMGFTAEGKSTDEVIKAILTKIPNVKSNGPKFRSDAESQKQVCALLADAINKRYGNIIDKRSEPAVVCQQVADVVSSLKSGMHFEFLSVHNEVRKVIRNLHILKSSLKDVFTPIMKEVVESKDQKLKTKAAKWIDLHMLVEQHIDLQLQLLTNLLNTTITPGETSLAALIKSDKDLGGLIDSVEGKPKPGSGVFSSYIAAVMHNLATTPSYALIVERALKQIGMSADEYAKTELPALRQKMSEVFANRDANDEQLHELAQSWEILIKNFSNAKDIANKLKSIKSVEETSEKSAEKTGKGEMSSNELTTMDKRVRDRRVFRDLVFQVFNRQLNDQFVRIFTAIDALANRIGDTVPVTEQLDGLVKALERFEQPLTLNTKYVYVTLVGYYNDAASKERREGFLGSLRMVLSYLDTMLEMNSYKQSASLLKDIADNMRAMISLVENYSDKVAQKFGGEDRVAPEEASEQCFNLDDNKEGGDAGEEVYGGDAPANPRLPESVLLRTSVKLKESISKIKYYYKVAQIKSGLKRAEGENENFAKEYTDIRADAIGKKVTEIISNQRRLLAELDDKTKTPHLYAWEKLADGVAKKDEKRKADKLKAGAKKAVEKHHQVYANFWRTIEAVDEYMRVFTNGMVKDPNAIRDLKAMLDETENLSDWYNNNVGRELHQVFDSFPAYIEGAGTAVGDADATAAGNTASNARVTANDTMYKITDDTHYYAKVGEASADFRAAPAAGAPAKKIVSYLPGNPYLVADPEDVDGGFRGKVHAKRVTQYLFALKNLIACFTYIGQKFAGEEIRKKVFMSPAVMYKNLCEYIESSAFGIGLPHTSYIHNLDTGYAKEDNTYDPTDADITRDLEARVRELESTPWVQRLGRDAKREKRALPEALAQLSAHMDNKDWIANQGFNSLIDSLGATSTKEAINATLEAARHTLKAVTHARNIPALAVPAAPLAAGAVATPARDVLKFALHIKNLREQRVADGAVAAQAHYTVDRMLTDDNVKLIVANPADANAWLLRQSGITVGLTNVAELNAALVATRALVGRGAHRGPYVGAAQDKFNDPPGNDHRRTYNFNTHAPGAVCERYIRLGVAARGVMPEEQDFAQVDFRRKYGLYMRSTIAEFAGTKQEQECDKFFVRAIKAISAKVLTIVGMYDVFDRPQEMQVMNPVRMILGADDSTPKIEADAVELYVRLPLLAMFYRDLFGFNRGGDRAGDNGAPLQNWVSNNEDDSEKITMFPEMDGTFAGLVRLLFKKNKTVKLENVTDQDLRDLIREINLIWNKSSKGETAVMDIIHEFVDEVNRRYGLVKRKDRDTYERDFGYRFDYDTYQSADTLLTDAGMPLDIAILPDEDRLENAPQPVAPSDAYVVRGVGAAGDVSVSQSRWNIKDEHYKLFYRFRCMLDNYFRKEDGSSYPMGGPDNEFTFRPAIKAASQQLKTEANNDERFKTVASLLRGYGAFRKLDVMKYILFHETVVTGLNTLSAVYALLNRFKLHVLASDVVEMERVLKDTNNADVANLANTNNVALKEVLRKLNFRAPNAEFDELVDKFVDTNAVAVHNTTRPVAGAAGDVTMRALVKHDLVLKDLLESVWALSNDLGGLVTFEFGASLSLNFGGLQAAVEETFRQVKYFLDLLRPHIDVGLYNRFVAKRNVGSYYWLQEQLVDKILVGRSSGVAVDELGTEERRPQYLNLDHLVQKVNLTYKKVVEVSRAAPAAVKADQVLAEMIFYNAKAAESGLHHTRLTVPTEAPRKVNYSLGLNRLLHRQQGDKYMFYPNQSNHYDQLYSWDNTSAEWNCQRSLLFSFNQLIAKFIQQFFDGAVDKIYSNLISHIVNGPLNMQVMNPDNCYPDTIRVRSPAAENLTAPGLGARAPPAAAVGRVTGTVGLRAESRDPLDVPTLVEDINVTILSVRDNDAWPTAPGVVPAGRRAGPGSAPSALYSFGARADPKSDAVLYSSLALILRNLSSSKNKAGQTAYLAENIADVSGYMKDKYKAQLPVFRSMFITLMRRGEFLKQFLSRSEEHLKLAVDRSGLALDRTVATPGMYGLADHPHVYTLADSDRACREFVALIDGINRGCASAVAGIDHVVRELADSPKYLELNPGFIGEYKNLYKRDPFMPVSSLLTVARPDASSSPLHLPLHAPGTPEYKLMYGERHVLATPDQEVSVDHIPGHKAIVDMHNMLAAGRDAADRAAADKLALTVVKLLRYVNEVHHYKGNLTTHLMWNAGNDVARCRAYQVLARDMGSLAREPLTDNLPAVLGALAGGSSNVISTALSTAAPAAADQCAYPAFAFTHTVSEIVDLTENSMRDQKIESVVNYLYPLNVAQGPDQTVQNIIDLNIVPINVHALMRSMPLVELYNYAYTFDRLVVELLYGIQTDAANDILKHLCADTDPDSADFRDKLARERAFNPALRPNGRQIRSTKDLFLALLVDPYRELLTADEYTYLYRIFSGDNNMELGRPKFLSDQVYNKALFQELYPVMSDPSDYAERGPRRRDPRVAAGATGVLTYIDNKTKLSRDNVNKGKGDHEDNEFDYTNGDGAAATPKSVKQVTVDPSIKAVLDIVGKLRTQTRFVRNLMFLVNVYRLLRLKLRKDLVYSKSLISKGHGLVREDGTEFALNQSYRGPQY